MTSADDCAQTKQASGWQAGVARLDITPPLHTWLAGFASRTRGAEGIHDPLNATALALATANSQAIIISCELLSLDAEDAQRMRKLIAEQTGVPEAQILIHTTHTHSGPLACYRRGYGPRDQDYGLLLERQIISAAVLATQRMQPVRLSYGAADAPIGVNRRASDGQVDSGATVLGIWPATPDAVSPIALILSASVHPVMFGGSNYLIGRDFPGFAIDYLERIFPGSICLYLTGTCSDVNPIGMRSGDPFGYARRHGGVLAGAAMQALFSGRPIESASLVGVSHEAMLALQPLPPIHAIRREIERLEHQFQEHPDGDLLASRSGPLAWAKEALAAHQGVPGAARPREAFSAELQCLVLGDFAITALPFEPFTAYGAIAAQSAPGNASLVVGYANGNHGYLPTAEAFTQSGYEVNTAYRYRALQGLAPQAPATVVQAMEELHAMTGALLSKTQASSPAALE